MHRIRHYDKKKPKTQILIIHIQKQNAAQILIEFGNNHNVKLIESFIHIWNELQRIC